MNHEILIENFINYTSRPSDLSLMNDYLPEKIDPVTFTEEFIDQRRKNLNLAREGSPKEKEEGLYQAKISDPVQLVNLSKIIDETFLDCDSFWVAAEEDTELEFSETELKIRIEKTYPQLKNC
jgi:hypothetical protein